MKKRQFPSAFQNHLENQLLDFGFLEFNMLAHNRVILHERELLGFGARIFLGHIEKACIGSRCQLYLDYVTFSHNSLRMSVGADRPQKAGKVKRTAY